MLLHVAMKHTSDMIIGGYAFVNGQFYLVRRAKSKGLLKHNIV